MRYLRRNVLLVYAIYALTLVSGLVVTPIIIGALGEDQYGLWAFITSLFVFLGLLEFGIGPTIIRFAAEQRGRGAQAETSALASTGLVLYGAIALATVVLGLALTVALPALIELPDSLVSPGRLAFLLVLAGLVVRFPLALFGNLLAGQQRYDLINLGSLLSTVVYTGVVGVALYLRGGGVVALALITLAATVVRLAFPAVWLWRELPGLRLSPSLVSRSHLRVLVGFSSHNFLINLASRVVFSTDVIVVGILLGAAAAAHYGVAAKLFTLAFGFGVAGVTMLFPALAELEGAEQLERQRRYLLAGVRIGLSVVLLAALPLALLPDGFLQAWLGEDYDRGFDAAVPVLALLMVSLAFAHPSHTLVQLLVARGRHARLALVRLATVAANLVLSVVLALAVGLWGVALATLLTEGFAATVVLPLLARRETGLEIRPLVLAWLRPAALAAAAALPTLVVLGRAIEVDTLLEFGAVGVCWALLFGLVTWLFGLEDDERRLIRGALRVRALPRVVEPTAES
ncbi:MAG: oligosaccharide flippase family protein [Actinobacteria bacterium]|nr:oligosaccharide flippase family protein [Actinomycetota bacterium]